MIKEMIISDNTQIVLNVSYIIGLVAFVWRIATNQSKMKNDIHENKRLNKELKAENKELTRKIETVENDHVDVKIDMAKINTKLEGIDIGITEIKMMLQKKDG
jgi:cell division protein FtsB